MARQKEIVKAANNLLCHARADVHQTKILYTMGGTNGGRIRIPIASTNCIRVYLQEQHRERAIPTTPRFQGCHDRPHIILILCFDA